jgi:plastocyanin
MTTLAILFAALAPTPAPPVVIKDNKFLPGIVSVKKGRTVTWRWTGQNRHDVWFSEGPRNCSRRRSGTCTRRFNKRGSFEYFCTLHGSMTGLVKVRRP